MSDEQYIKAAKWCAKQIGKIDIQLGIQKTGIPKSTFYNWTETKEFWEKVRDFKSADSLRDEIEVDNDTTAQAKTSDNPQMKSLYYKKLCRWNDKQEVVHSGNVGISLSDIQKAIKSAEIK
jgi:hypothetical protein